MNEETVCKLAEYGLAALGIGIMGALAWKYDGDLLYTVMGAAGSLVAIAGYKRLTR